MAIIAMINKADDKLHSMFIAELTDFCPEGYYFVELPPGYSWVDGKIMSTNQVYSGIKQLQVF